FVALLNAYWDIGNYHGFTPYLGAGLGIAHLEVSGFTATSTAQFTYDVPPANANPVLTIISPSTSVDNSETNFAWALMAGTSYDISDNAKLDIGYRYLNMGSGVSLSSGLIDCICGTEGQPMEVSDLTSHEIRVGIRWKLSKPTALPSYK
ncbi:MAG: outer membrane beta-barrel protein, partial [Pseudomonadota bacterium]